MKPYIHTPRILVSDVPTEHRMIGIDSYTICESLKNVEPQSAISRALTEVLCLREEIKTIQK